MSTTTLGQVIRDYRQNKNLSQRELAAMLYVDRSTVANWESGRRVPDASLITRIGHVLQVDASYLMKLVSGGEMGMNIIMVDDEKLILSGSMPVLEKLFPEASIVCFTKPSEAIRFAETNPVDLAFLDIEIGKTNGMDLCKNLLDINSRTKVIFLTAYMDYSLDAWETGASGYILKPLTVESAQKQLMKLRLPGFVSVS